MEPLVALLITLSPVGLESIETWDYLSMGRLAVLREVELVSWGFCMIRMSDTGKGEEGVVIRKF